jgi:hypothetical protein
MITIHKYELKFSHALEMELGTVTKGGQRTLHILHVAPDPKGQPCIWCLVDTDLPKIQAEVYIVGTGQRAGFSDHVKYVGTFQSAENVWHIFVKNLANLVPTAIK